jgi:hypothetical protein
MLITQIKVNNVFSLMTIVISICTSFLVAYFGLVITGNIPPELTSFVLWLMFFLIIGFIVSFSVSWIISSRLIMSKEIRYLKKTFGLNEETEKKEQIVTQ